MNLNINSLKLKKMNNVKEEVIFLSGQGNHQLGAKILSELSELFGQRCLFNHINFNKHSEGEFDNRIVNFEKINGKIVVLYQSMYELELLYEAMEFIRACKNQYGAKYVIGVFPFLWNRRQDSVMEETEKERWLRKVAKPDEIQRLNQTVYFLKCAGLDEMIVATPHSSAMKKACIEYGIKFYEIDPSPIFANKAQTFYPEEQDSIYTYAPDAGSIPRAINLARILNRPVLFNLKNRAINSITSILNETKEEMEKLTKEFREYYKYKLIHYITPENVMDKIIIMVEDEVASGGTSNNTGQLLKKLGAKSVLLFATHPVLTWGWRNKLFINNPFTKIIMTDTIPRGYEKRTGGKVTDISLDSLFASSLFKVLNTL